MIYVKGRWDVRLSKGWRYEPIMINAPCVPIAALHPQPHTSVAEGETLQHSGMRASFCLFILHFSFCPSSWILSPSSSLPIICGCHVTCGLVLLLLLLMEAKQSPLSCGWAIRLCQTLSVHASTQEKEEAKGREWSDILDSKSRSWCLVLTNIVSSIGIADVLNAGSLQCCGF